ncbi:MULTISPECIES: ABC transporter substrate-binding protein [unclassified Microbacterium]|uniref:ABC transporter substrate-binding protein n=1 Tax=unclassified Microbacterium TaxID=2609290 RepID=UPI00386AFCC1
MRHGQRRRAASFIALGSVAAVLVSGCAAADSSGSGEEKVTLRFNWWGSDARHALTQEAIDLFEKEHPNITVQAEYSNYADYWNKLSTGAASGDLPDVLQIVDPFMYSYIDNGQLLDLTTVSEQLPLDGFTEQALSFVETDGGIYGVPAGLTAFGVSADPTLFEKAGVEFPDDETWTWQDWIDISADITKALPDIEGSALPLDEQTFTVWIRQQGEDFWNGDSTDVGFTAETATAYWEWLLDLRDNGGVPSVEESIERQSAGGSVEQSAIGTQVGAMQIGLSGQQALLEEAVGHEVGLLFFPGEAEAESTGIFSKPGLFYGVSAGSDHPEEAAMLVDYLANSPEVGELFKFDRGVPANADVLEAITPELSEAEQRVAEYMQRIEEQDPAPFSRANIDAGAIASPTFARLNQDVLFDRLTPKQAAEQFIAELRAEM